MTAPTDLPPLPAMNRCQAMYGHVACTKADGHDGPHEGWSYLAWGR